MKKFLMMAFAVVAMTFAACGNAPKDESEELGKQLTEQIEKKDQKGIEKVLGTIKDKIKALATVENITALKDQLPNYQKIVKDNAEQIKSIVGDNAIVSGAIDAITGLDASKVDAASIANFVSNLK